MRVGGEMECLGEVSLGRVSGTLAQVYGQNLRASGTVRPQPRGAKAYTMSALL